MSDQEDVPFVTAHPPHMRDFDLTSSANKNKNTMSTTPKRNVLPPPTQLNNKTTTPNTNSTTTPSKRQLDQSNQTQTQKKPKITQATPPKSSTSSKEEPIRFVPITKELLTSPTKPKQSETTKQNKSSTVNAFNDELDHFESLLNQQQPTHQLPVPSSTTPQPQFPIIKKNYDFSKCSVILMASRNATNLLGKHQSQIEFMGGAIVEDFETSPVLPSHLVVDSDKLGRTKRTLKYSISVLEGIWIMRTEWLTKSLNAGRWLIEEPFEIAGDEIELGGPRKSRFQQRNQSSKFQLFSDISFLVAKNSFDSNPTAQEIEKLIKHGGGTIIELSELNIDELDEEEKDRILRKKRIFTVIRHPNLTDLDRYHISEVQLFRFISGYTNSFFKD